MDYFLNFKPDFFAKKELNVKVSGAKNFSIKAIAASILTNEDMYYSNLPLNFDVSKTFNMLKSIGAEIEFDEVEKKAKINTKNIQNFLKNSNNTNMITFLISAALLKKHESVIFPMFKGCNLGDRKHDFHYMIFDKFNISYEEKDGHILIKKNSEIHGCEINLPFPSVGATETALFIASYAKGVTKIHNVAIEPEIQSLIKLLNNMGASVYFESDRTIVVYGNENLCGVKSYIHGDLLEVGTWAAFAAISSQKITVEGFFPELIGTFLGAYKLLGGGFEQTSDTTMQFFKKTSAMHKILKFETGVFPALRTDFQPIIAAIAALSEGTTTYIHETIYSDRLDYISDFNNLGCNLIGINECCEKNEKCLNKNEKSLHSVIIHGVAKLNPKVNEIKMKTIRSGMANLLLSSTINHPMVMKDIEIVERGYCSLFEKLNSLNVNVSKKLN